MSRLHNYGTLFCPFSEEFELIVQRKIYLRRNEARKVNSRKCNALLGVTEYGFTHLFVVGQKHTLRARYSYPAP